MTDANYEKETPSQNKKDNLISADLERALFVRFWTWLGIVGSVIILAVGAISSFFAQALTEKALTAARDAAILTSNQNLEVLSKRIQDIQIQADAVREKTNNIVSTISNLQGKSEEAWRSISARGAEGEDSLRKIQQSASSIQTFSAINDAVAKISKDSDFARLVSANFEHLPKGSVVAFDLDACPNGWRTYELAAGRVLIGAGIGQGLTPRQRLATGGDESATLLIENIPSHSHRIDLGTLNGQGLFGQAEEYGNAILGRARGPAFNSRTEAVGASKAFSIMPPFLAITFCRKE